MTPQYLAAFHDAMARSRLNLTLECFELATFAFLFSSSLSKQRPVTFDLPNRANRPLMRKCNASNFTPMNLVPSMTEDLSILVLYVSERIYQRRCTMARDIGTDRLFCIKPISVTSLGNYA
ncbi:hypothetical protein FVEG_17558 [Fusarium verticillioides 7600]|uniref:Uncharacterized protein n=1 Tax=Gibberella moniliformis (strain M3125 / FGSC 7600) TaxID=334819 RepID=W7NGQ4_GIBM7|nr:hypothetical protein FVEG_17558 [Fusarium verticillioides 7600]EWG55617.1 hypothetical protein FVEG_17558 [Fusarium verticillioides 7600]